MSIQLTLYCLIISQYLFFCLIARVNCDGLLLLYRPRDISTECAFSHHLRYDISFGMGMSDTITLVFRSLLEIDYECVVEIVTESWANIVIVIKYPTTLGVNCGANKDTITVLKKNICLRLCDLIGARNLLSPFYVAAVRGRIRFRFLSNSSINADINANMYQVTATSARPEPPKGCNLKNETICEVNNDNFCFTSGVVCDGINNCGVTDWFDERRSDCGLPEEKLGFGPVVAVIAALFCGFLAGGHILLRCLPPLANSFFIFNANEDNRLCIDPMFKAPGHRDPSIEKAKRTSLIPVSLSSSSASSQEHEESQATTQYLQSITSGEPSKSPEEFQLEEYRFEEPKRKTTMRTMAEKFHTKFWTKDKKLKSMIDI